MNLSIERMIVQTFKLHLTYRRDIVNYLGFHVIMRDIEFVKKLNF